MQENDMLPQKQQTDQEWIREQIEQYRQIQPAYQKYAQVIQQVLERATQTMGIEVLVQTRSKAIATFAEKSQRKKAKYRDPLLRMTDLCGARVIVPIREEVKATCEFIEKHFDIDRENSLDVSQRLKPNEFGYRSVHYVVQFRRGVFPTKDIPIEIPEETYPQKDHPMKCEIQVQTILEYAWAGFTHDRTYKRAFAISDKWKRELAVIAGNLEEADRSFSQIQAGLRTYAASYGAYMTEAQMHTETEILETVLTCDPDNAELAYRIGKLAMTLGNWEKAIGIFSRYTETGYQPILRDLGVALCKVHAKEPKGAQYILGQKYLQAACATQHRDPEAWASLAGTWKTINQEETRKCYRMAFEIDPSDPYGVSNYLVYEIAYRRDLTAVSLMLPAINAAIERCRDQIEVGMNLPWAYYNLGILYLLLDRPYDSLAAYAKAIQASGDEWMVETSYRLLGQLASVKNSLIGYKWVRGLFLIGQVVKYKNAAALEKLKDLASPRAEPLLQPVVIVSGALGADIEADTYRQLLLQSFHNYKGTIVSGGMTTSVVNNLVGEVQASYPQNIRTVRYLPNLIPTKVTADQRYAEVRNTTGNDFSALNVLQYWADILISGMEPAYVRLLGVGGDVIAGFEYRLALFLGAGVGIIAGSGDEIARLIQDDDWKQSKNLIVLPADGMTLMAFIGSGRPELDPDTRSSIARAIHAAYREEQSHRAIDSDPSLAEWDQLLTYLQESNFQQADQILEKLQQIGCSVKQAEDPEGDSFVFTESEVETMSEMEHGRWVIERFRDGWRWGEERDVLKKVSPYIVPWSKLPEEVKEWDRQTVRKIPKYLDAVGLGIRRNKGS
jgi:ppGpp synthetase/RelA/SpoT-type nucleotidyltranferase